MNGEPAVLSGTAAPASPRPRTLGWLRGDGDVVSFWRRALATSLARLTAVPLGVISAVLVARGLGPAGRGTLGVMLTVGAIGVQIGNLGLPSAGAHAIAGDRSRLRPMLGLVLTCAFGVGAVLVLGVGVFAQLWPGVIAVDSPALVWLAAAWIPLALLLLLLQNVLLGLHEIRAYNLLQVGNDVVGVAAVALAFVLGWRTPARFFLAMGTVLAGACVVALVLALRRSGWRVAGPQRGLLREATRYGARAYLATLFSYMLINFDLLMVARMLGAREAGYYAIAGRMAEILYMIPVAVGGILFVTISAMRAERWAFARRVTGTLALGFAPVVLVAAVLARPVVHLLFGDAFADAVVPFLWLLPGIYLLGVNTPLMNYLAGIGMPPVAVVAPAAGLVANVLLNLWLIPRLGLRGASLASSLAYGLMLAISLIYVRRRPESRVSPAPAPERAPA